MIPHPARIAGNVITAHAPRERNAPLPGALARRRMLITLTKYLLPLAAVMLLSAVALWPDFIRHNNFIPSHLPDISGEFDGAQLRHARYHGVDENGQPYTLTTAMARQLDADRVALTKPVGDITQTNGVWLNLKAEHGIFVQKASTLDLWEDVVLYRDDGTTLTTASATIDIKDATATGGQAVHAEGPFGVLDAAGFTVTEKGTAIQFAGPAHVILNGATP